MRILIISDAWFPQLNGVVRALSTTRDQLTHMGHDVEVIGPAGFKTLPCPTYPEIRLALTTPGRIGRMIERFAPDAVHIATEGPLGWCARHWLKRRNIPFTTSFHTMFPLYLKLRGGIPESWSFALLRLFHNAATRTMYSTETLRSTLARHGFQKLTQWVRGVDTALFRPVPPTKLVEPSAGEREAAPLASKEPSATEREAAPLANKEPSAAEREAAPLANKEPSAAEREAAPLANKEPSAAEREAAPPTNRLPDPILMYVGRLAVEKNLDAFLSLNVPGTKVVVGEGPQGAALRRRYPDALFLGARYGEELVAHYCAADVLVFPSKTDTLGLVMLEAAACGVPVAALPVPGPNDVIGGSGAGVLDEDLGAAIAAALKIDPRACREYALGNTWDVSARQFLGNLAPVSLKESAATLREGGIA